MTSTTPTGVMPDSVVADDTDSATAVSRRRLLRTAGASGLALGLAGCTGGDAGPGPGGTGVGGGTTTGNPGDAGKTTIEFASDSNIKDAWGELQPVLYEAGLSEDVEVNVIAGAWESGKRQSKYQQWLSANREKPDVLMMDNGWTIPFIAREQLLNLSDHLPSKLLDRVDDDYFTAIARTAKDRRTGDYYGIPLWIDLPTVQYRKDLVTEAGYDPDGNGWATESMSWKRFAEVTETVKEQTDTQYGFTFQAKAYNGLACCDFNEFMSGWGGAYFGPLENLFGPVGERPVTVDGKPVVDSIRMVRTFIHGEDDEHALDGYAGDISPDAVLQWTEEPSRKPFTNGNAVAHRNWPYSININGAEDAFGEDLGVMPIPYGVPPENAEYEGTGGPIASVGGWNLTVNPNSNDREAALNAIEAMVSEEFRFKLFEVVGFTPPIPEMLDSKRARDVPVMGRYLDSLVVSGENAIPRPVTVVWPQEATQIATQVNSTYSGSVPPGEAMSTLKGQIEQIEQSV